MSVSELFRFGGQLYLGKVDPIVVHIGKSTSKVINAIAMKQDTANLSNLINEVVYSGVLGFYDEVELYPFS